MLFFINNQCIISLILGQRNINPYIKQLVFSFGGVLVQDLNSHINNTLFKYYNIFSSFKLSGYLTLVDKKGQPVIFEMNGYKHIFTFNKYHFDLNLSKNKKGFNFYENLFIAGLLKPEFTWKNLLLFKFKKIISSYKAIEPRHLSVKVIKGKTEIHLFDNETNIVGNNFKIVSL